MGNFQFSISMLKKEYQRSLVYTLTLCLTIAVTFLFFNIIEHPYFIDNVNAQHSQTSFSSTLSFMIIILCAFMIIFANNFYISKKTKEIAIMTMSGSGFLKITLYLFYQNLIMTCIAFVIGLILGGGAFLLVHQCLIHYFAYQGSFVISVNATINTIICIVVIIAVQLLYASGFVYRKDIQYMLTDQSRNQSVDVRMIPIPSLFYIFLYFFGIILLLTMPYDPSSMLLPCCIGALGVGGIIKYCLKDMLMFIKKKKYIGDQHQLISLSHFMTSLSRCLLLIEIYVVSSSVMVAMMILWQNDPREMFVTVIGFVVVILLLLASILYKYSMDVSQRCNAYYHLYMLGYTFSKLLKILRQEVIYFYTFFVGMPLVYIVLSLIQAYLHQGVTMSFMITIILSQVILAIFAGLLTYRFYKTTLINTMKEGIHYE